MVGFGRSRIKALFVTVALRRTLKSINVDSVNGRRQFYDKTRSVMSQVPMFMPFSARFGGDSAAIWRCIGAAKLQQIGVDDGAHDDLAFVFAAARREPPDTGLLDGPVGLLTTDEQAGELAEGGLMTHEHDGL